MFYVERAARKSCNAAVGQRLAAPTVAWDDIRRPAAETPNDGRPATPNPLSTNGTIRAGERERAGVVSSCPSEPLLQRALKPAGGPQPPQPKSATGVLHTRSANGRGWCTRCTGDRQHA